MDRTRRWSRLLRWVALSCLALLLAVACSSPGSSPGSSGAGGGGQSPAASDPGDGY